jgi:hypothetical protein
MNKPVSKILIRAHGGPDGFSLSETENGAIDTHKIEDRGANAWEHQIVEKGIVTKDAEVVFESCSLGAGGFPQSLYEKTGISALTSPKNIVGSSVVGAPGVIRVGGEVKFGTSPPDFNENKRDPSDLSDPVSIKR